MPEDRLPDQGRDGEGRPRGAQIKSTEVGIVEILVAEAVYDPRTSKVPGSHRRLNPSQSLRGLARLGWSKWKAVPVIVRLVPSGRDMQPSVRGGIPLIVRRIAHALDEFIVPSKGGGFFPRVIVSGCCAAGSRTRTDPQCGIAEYE